MSAQPSLEIAPRIVVNPAAQQGRPVVKGTRVPVELVVGKLAGGMTTEEVMKEFEIEREDVLAALSFAARAISDETYRAI